MLKRYLDFIATEARFSFLQQTGPVFAGLDRFDKSCYQAALLKVPKDQRVLLLSGQTLELWTAAKHLQFYLEGEGRCSHCGQLESGLVHEAWGCPAFRDVQCEADPELQMFTTANTPLHTLLGLPPHLPAEEGDHLIAPLPGCSYEDRMAQLFFFNKQLDSNGYELLETVQRFPGITASLGPLFRLPHHWTALLQQHPL